MIDRVMIRNAEVDGNIVDVSWSDGVVTDVTGVGGHDRGPVWLRDIDANGAALIPGLHDHHIHLLALASARSSVRVGPPEVTTTEAFVESLARACSSSADGWVRAVGYHECVAGDLDADQLDVLVPGGRVAIRIQHRSGQLWVLNRRAIDLAQVDSLEDAGVERDENHSGLKSRSGCFSATR